MSTEVTKHNDQTPTHFWRADITGLRALAVIPVILYHAFPMLAPGGYVGVDIFFVISGFLISGIIFRQLKSRGNVCYGDFYAKRIRRILPNLLILFLVVVAFGWFVLLPREYESVARSVTASAFFYQNFSLLKRLGDYFAPAVAQSPLMHLWSLAIEEQFYLIFPLLCWGVWKISRSPRILFAVICGGTLLSLIACLMVSDKTFDFYFPLTRFWELGAGIILSFCVEFYGLKSSQIPLAVRNTTSVIGFGLILFSVAALGHGTVFPGWATLLPIAGSLLFIYSGHDALINRFLSLKPFVFIGLISYSLYLWHWPILSYLHIVILEPTTWQLAAALLVAFLLSVLIYVGVENPVRRMTKGIWGKASVAVLVILLLGFYGLGKLIRAMDGLPDRQVPIVQMFGAAGEDWAGRAGMKDISLGGVEVWATPQENRQILFIGDSHTQQYAPRAQALAEKTNVGSVFFTVPGCLTVPGVPGEITRARTEECGNFAKNLEKVLAAHKFRKVVFSGKFGGYAFQTAVSIENGQKRLLGPEFLAQGVKALRDLVERVSPETEFVVILDSAWLDRGAAKFGITNRLDLSDIKPGFEVQPDQLWLRGNETVRKALEGNATFIDGSAYLCPQGLCGFDWLIDTDHLRASYVRDRAVWLDPVFEDLK